jgi:16S rRNA processing protein RimM
LKKDNFVSIGKFVRSFGRKGELKVNFFLEHSQKQYFFSKIFFRNKGIFGEYIVEHIRPFKDYFLVKIKGISSITQAEEIAGVEIFLPKENLQPLDKDNYYLFQLVGCEVLTKEGKKIGVVEDVQFIKENELLVVRKSDREFLIPFSKSLCLRIDLEDRCIVIDPPDGLLELNEI